MAAVAMLELGRRLIEVRSDAGLSQKAFSELIGTSIASYQRYESGDRELPLSCVVELFQRFRVNPLWLLLGDSAAPKRVATTDEQAQLTSEVYEMFERPIAESGQPVSFRERKIAWDFVLSAALAKQSVPMTEIKIAHNQLLRTPR